MWAGILWTPPDFKNQTPRLIDPREQAEADSEILKRSAVAIDIGNSSVWSVLDAVHQNTRLVFGNCVYDFCNHSMKLKTKGVAISPGIFPLLQQSDYVSTACKPGREGLLCGKCKKGFAVTPYYSVRRRIILLASGALFFFFFFLRKGWKRKNSEKRGKIEQGMRNKEMKKKGEDKKKKEERRRKRGRREERRRTNTY